jgi:hypothetical protein
MSYEENKKLLSISNSWSCEEEIHAKVTSIFWNMQTNKQKFKATKHTKTVQKPRK